MFNFWNSLQSFSMPKKSHNFDKGANSENGANFEKDPNFEFWGLKFPNF